MAEGMGIQQKKREVALYLLQEAGTLVEFWTEKTCGQTDITAEEAREFLAGWLKNLPGDAWDTRLDPPSFGSV